MTKARVHAGKFIQIAAAGTSKDPLVYALDDLGDVWSYYDHDKEGFGWFRVGDNEPRDVDPDDDEEDEEDPGRPARRR